jgi:hypothetical protein
MNSQKNISSFLFLSLVVAGCLLISPTANAGDISSHRSEEVSQLLSQIKTEAIALKDDANILAKWAGPKQVSWEGHGRKLHEIHDHINQAGRLLTKLQEAKSTASPWQQQAIDRVYPLLKELADNTEATINHLNDDRMHVRFAAYEDYAKAGSDLAEELATLVCDYADYGDHEAEFHRLQEKLQPAVS